MKHGLFISFHGEHTLRFFGTQLGGAQAEQLAKVANVFAAITLASFLTYLGRRFTVRYVLLLFCALFVIASLVFTVLLGSPNALTVWSFYIFGDMYSSLSVPVRCTHPAHRRDRFSLRASQPIRQTHWSHSTAGRYYRRNRQARVRGFPFKSFTVDRLVQVLVGYRVVVRFAGRRFEQLAAA